MWFSDDNTGRSHRLALKVGLQPYLETKILQRHEGGLFGFLNNHLATRHNSLATVFQCSKIHLQNTRIVAVSFEWASTHIFFKIAFDYKKKHQGFSTSPLFRLYSCSSDVIALFKRFPAEEKEWLLAFLETLHWK